MKWILRYLKGSSRMCLCFGGPELILEDYANVDMIGDLNGRKSTSGFLFTLQGEQCLSTQNCKSVLPYPLLMQNMLL